MGTMAPWRTGLAKIGVLRLGNKEGKREWRVMPRVCGSLLLGDSGVTRDCTTFRCRDAPSDSEGDEGRYILIGMCLSGAPCA